MGNALNYTVVLYQVCANEFSDTMSFMFHQNVDTNSRYSVSFWIKYDTNASTYLNIDGTLQIN